MTNYTDLIDTLLIYEGYKTQYCYLKNGRPFQDHQGIYPIKLPKAESFAAILLLNEEIPASRNYRLSDLDAVRGTKKAPKPSGSINKWQIPEFTSDGTIKKLKCKVGYYNKLEKSFIEKDIIIENIVIESVEEYKNIKDDGFNEYCYYINTHSINEDFKFTFKATGYDPLNEFIEYVLPIVNKELNAGTKYSDLNLLSFNESIGDSSWRYDLKEHNENRIEDFKDVLSFNESIWDITWQYDSQKKYYNSGFQDMLKMIYNSKLESGKFYSISIEMASKYTYNTYVEWLLSKSLYVESNFTGNKKVWSGRFRDDVNWINQELELGEINENIRNTLNLRLMASIILNYTPTYYIHACKFLNPIWNDSEYITPKISKGLQHFYNFITHSRCYKYIDGQYRAGRDDYEWKEDTYIIPSETGYRIPDKLLSLINKKLGLGLCYEEEGDWYYYQKKYDREYIGGMFWQRKGGEVSNFELVASMLKIALLEYRDEEF